MLNTYQKVKLLSSVGAPVEANLIATMTADFRLPTLLKVHRREDLNRRLAGAEDAIIGLVGGLQLTEAADAFAFCSFENFRFLRRNGRLNFTARRSRRGVLNNLISLFRQLFPPQRSLRWRNSCC